MTAVLNILLPILTAACVVFGVLQLVKALRQRARIRHQVYGVGKVDARRRMQIGLLVAAMLFVLGVVFLGIWGVLLTRPDPEPAIQETPSPPSASVTPDVSATPDISPSATTTPAATTIPTLSQTPTMTPSPTAPTPTPLATATATTTLTPTLSVPTAVVSSNVGVYLRSQPSTTGEQLEWLLEGTTLVVLPEQVEGEDFLWQRVRTLAGNEGWVAVPFISYNE